MRPTGSSGVSAGAGHSPNRRMGAVAVMSAAVLVLTLTACGRTDDEAARDTKVATAAPAEQTAGPGDTVSSATLEARAPSANCDALQSAAGPDDIMGLKVGMSLEEVRARMACGADDYTITESQRVLKTGEAHGAQIVVLEAKTPHPRASVRDYAQNVLKVTFARTGQQATVIQIDRWAYYHGASRPALTSYRGEVEAKYQGISFDDVGTAYPLGVLSLTVDGQRLSAANRLRKICIGNGAWQHKLEMSPLCGPAFAIQIYRDRQDPNYVSSVQATLSNPSFTADILEASRQAAGEEAQRKLDEIIANGPKADL